MPTPSLLASAPAVVARRQMFVPHNAAFVDLLYPGTAFRHPSLAPIGETQLMAARGALYAGAMEQPTLMARPSPLARMSPSSLSATSHERPPPTTFQPVVLLNQHATPSDPGQPTAYSPQPGPSGADLLSKATAARAASGKMAV